MRRIFVDADLNDAFNNNETVTITGDDARHIGYSLRAKIGDEFTLVDKEGTAILAAIEKMTAAAVIFRLLERIENAVESPLEMELAVCILKGEKFDFVIQKAVELGVDKIVPLLSENCAVKLDEKKARQRAERWRKIALEAAKQCGRGKIPEVAGVTKFIDYINNFEFLWPPPKLPTAVSTPLKGGQEGLVLIPNSELRTPNLLKIIAYENATAPLKNILRRSGAKKIIAVTGPEGGLTAKEIEIAEGVGFLPVSLGPRILRAETAAVSVAAVVQYELGDLGGCDG